MLDKMLLQATAMITTQFLPFSKSLTQTINQVARLPKHIHTLLLFTRNDLATFALPTTLFALSSTLSGYPLTTNRTPTLFPTLLLIPQTILLVFLTLLIFNIANQRTPAAVAEDTVNKPHRPLPRGLMTCEGARKLLLIVVPVVVAIGWASGVLEEVLFINVLSWMYNDLGGSEDHWALKNLLVSVGYGVYSSLALRIMSGPMHTVTTMGLIWIGIITLVMFATQHIADLKDAEGDFLRGRRSAPVVLGEDVARWSIAVPLVFFSAFCPAFFGLGLASFLFTVALGTLVAGHTVFYRSLKADKVTWKLWVFWTCTLFALPLVKNPEVFIQTWNETKAMICVSGECAGMLNLGAVSGVALVVEGRRVVARLWNRDAKLVSIPEIVVDGVFE